MSKPKPEYRLVCTECGHRFPPGTVLIAAHPFDPKQTVLGCSQCFSVDHFRGTCDEQGCWDQDTTGMPTPTGYRRTCWKHSPMNPTNRSAAHAEK